MRRRTRLACTPCRIKKTGCDGARPSCATCTAKGLASQCVYQHAARAVAQPELMQGHPNHALPGRTPTLTPIARQGPSSVSPAAGPEPNPSSPPLQLSSEPPSSTSVSEARARSQLESNRALFGLSSNYTFIQQVADAVDTDTAATRQQPGEDAENEQEVFIDPIGFPVHGHGSPSIDLDALSIPERRLSDKILVAYWENHHIVMPVLHQPSFVRDYEEHWRSSNARPATKRNRQTYLTFYATLNTVFALGCQYCAGIPPQQRKRVASTFYTRSLRLLPVDMVDIYTLEVVQLLLLRSWYLMFTSNSVRCWSMSGAAIRAAQGIGLHLTKADDNQLQRVMKRRVWFGLLVLDRFAAASFGWPILSFNPNAMPLPDDIDDEYLSETGEGRQPDNLPCRVTCFNQYIKLCVFICTDILESLYSNFDENSDTGSHAMSSRYLREVPDLCSKLDDFLDNMPSFLKVDTLNKDNKPLGDCLSKQSQFLRERTMYVRLLLLRPSLATSVRAHMQEMSMPTETSTASLLRGSTIKDINMLCVSTAHLVLDNLHQSLQTMNRLTTWHSVRMAFGSLVVLMAATLLPELGVDLDQIPAKSSWTKAFDIFEHHKLQDPATETIMHLLWNHRHKFDASRTKRSAQGSLTFNNAFPATTFDEFLLDTTWLDSMLGSGSSTADDFNRRWPDLNMSDLGAS